MRWRDMGFNTAVLVLNDGLGEIVANPQQFADAVWRLTNSGGTAAVGNHGNPVTVLPGVHADTVQLIAVGGNYITPLVSLHTGGVHHTPEAQEALLREWADYLGFDLTRK